MDKITFSSTSTFGFCSILKYRFFAVAMIALFRSRLKSDVSACCLFSGDRVACASCEEDRERDSGLTIFISFSNSWIALSTIATPFLFVTSESSSDIPRFESSVSLECRDLNPGALSVLTIMEAFFLTALVTVTRPSLISSTFLI